MGHDHEDASTGLALLRKPSPTGREGTDDTRCTVWVDHPVMVHRWRQLTFLHWPYEPETIQRHLPPGLKVDTFDGRAWIGLIPFHLQVFTGRGRLGTTFPEANVRTYVVGPDGTPGIWFLSLDASRFDAVLAARATHSVPYHWARMNATADEAEALYTSARIRRRGHDATLHARIGIGRPIPSEQATDLDKFTTARFCFYALRGGRLMRAWVEHDPWRLRQASVIELSETLIAALGLPAPDRAPLARYAEGVDARVGRLHVAHTAGGATLQWTG